MMSDDKGQTFLYQICRAVKGWSHQTESVGVFQGLIVGLRLTANPTYTIGFSKRNQLTKFRRRLLGYA